MNGQKGFVLIIGLLLGTAILLILMSSYFGYWGGRTEMIPATLNPVVGSEDVTGKRVLKYKITEISSGQVKSGRMTMIPFSVFDYRLSLQETDSGTYAEILVENIAEGVYETVKVYGSVPEQVRDIEIEIEFASI